MTDHTSNHTIDWDTIDFFTDASVVDDPWPYFEHLRKQCPVQRIPHHDALAVTGYDEAAAVYRDHSTFSSCVSVLGPVVPLPFEPVGDDLGPLIEEHRADFILGEYMIALDPPRHTAQRSLLSRLLTPKRLKENEAFMWRLAEQHIDDFVASGRCELMNDFARPFTLLVIADLLGVPAADHELFRTRLGAQRPGDVSDNDGSKFSLNPLEFLDEWFTHYVVDRRRAPQNDVLTELATATLPDGSVPDVAEVVRVATFLFGAGQDTTARLITTTMRFIAEDPTLQRLLREDRRRITDVIEESLRVEGVVKTDFRLARVPATIGDVDVPAGTIVMIAPGAVNRDPRHFERPDVFDIDRPNAREHLAFGRGIHACPGAALARAEARVSIELLLDRLADITISETEHGPPGARRFVYEPTFVLRGMQALHLEFEPIEGTR